MNHTQGKKLSARLYNKVEQVKSYLVLNLLDNLFTLIVKISFNFLTFNFYDFKKYDDFIITYFSIKKKSTFLYLKYLSGS